ncbi:YqeB family protein [Paractinoplanes globisporus]|uniref:DUF308 domain-containing protein n=1 Tax=Paractinoplanes globisporus TaxID=113565 RepID=A0ABW6WMI6_9ACTN|nr:hypothetical protein [Actinoplanes globisporus]
MLEPTSIVPTPRWARVLLWLGLPAVGAALLLAVAWLLSLAWLPLPGPLRLARELPQPAASIAVPALGVVLGLILAALADRESLTVRITPAEVVLSRPGATVAVPRSGVAVAFADRDELMLLGPTGRELAREPSHLSRGRLRDAFTRNGIAWADQDPYLSSYRRWVPGLPELPAAAHALFAARQKALDSGDDGDRRELRAELGRLGYVVRDDRKRQYWRRTDG